MFLVMIGTCGFPTCSIQKISNTFTGFRGEKKKKLKSPRKSGSPSASPEEPTPGALSKCVVQPDTLL